MFDFSSFSFPLPFSFSCRLLQARACSGTRLVVILSQKHGLVASRSSNAAILQAVLAALSSLASPVSRTRGQFSVPRRVEGDRVSCCQMALLGRDLHAVTVFVYTKGLSSGLANCSVIASDSTATTNGAWRSTQSLLCFISNP